MLKLIEVNETLKNSAPHFVRMAVQDAEHCDNWHSKDASNSLTKGIKSRQNDTTADGAAAPSTTKVSGGKQNK